MLAIVVGGIFGNVVCILDFLEKSFELHLLMLLMLAGVAWLSVYFLFMRPRKTLYALACIPSAYICGMSSVDFWWKMLRLPADANMNFARAAFLFALCASIFMCSIVVFIMEYIRFRKWLKGKNTNSKGEKTTESELMQTEKDGKQK